MPPPTKQTSDPRGLPIEPTPLANFVALPPKAQKSVSIKIPSDPATERSRAFDAFFGIFFASGGLYVGYGLGILGPLGEKWLKFRFGMTDDASMFFGIANLG